MLKINHMILVIVVVLVAVTAAIWHSMTHSEVSNIGDQNSVSRRQSASDQPQETPVTSDRQNVPLSESVAAVRQSESATVPVNETPSRPEPSDRIGGAPMLAELQKIRQAERDERIRLTRELYSKWKESKEWQTFLRQTAAGKTPGSTERDRYFAATFVGGFGYPTRIGPNALKDNPLGLYIKIQSGISLPPDNPEVRHIELDPQLEDLAVTVESNKTNDLTLQEILEMIIEKYDLSFEIRKGDIFYITKNG